MTSRSEAGPGSAPPASANSGDRIRAAGEQTAQRQEQLLAAVLDVEQAMATAPDGGEEWHDAMRDAAERLHVRLNAHVAESEQSDGLLAEITRIEPSFAPRTDRLRREHQTLLGQAASFETQAREGGSAEILRRLATELVAEINRHRHQATSLLSDTYNLDVAAGD